MKSESALKTIGEVSKSVGVPQHVIRFWEKKFEHIKPIQKGKGRRYYTQLVLKQLFILKDLLYNQKYSIKGAQKKVKENIIISKKSCIESQDLIKEIELLKSEINKFL